MQLDVAARDRRTLERIKAGTLDRQGDAVLILGRDEKPVYLNRTARNLFLFEQELEVVSFSHILSTLENPEVIQDIAYSAINGASQSHHVTLRFSERQFEGTLHAWPVRTAGECSHAVLVFHDETSYVRLQMRMTQEEFYDRTTGLYNRRTLDVLLELELEKISRETENAGLAMLMIQLRNLDHLRAVYHELSVNHIMERVGSSIRQALRTNDLVFRYDENSFAAIITRFAWKTDLLIMAQRVDDQIATPFHQGDTYIHLHSCIGISVFPDDGTTASRLMSNGVSALNHALETNQAWLMFNPNIHQLAVDRLLIRSGLSAAIKKQQLDLYYMPLVDSDRKIRGIEALVRWNHPERGLLGPESFLPVAIHSRVIGAISRWVMYRLQEDYRTCLADSGLFVSFNLSALDFSDVFLLEAIESSLDGGMDPALLKIEITESEFMQHQSVGVDLMSALTKRGIETFIDDFGVGHSSLSYLRDLPAHYVKIDHSFVAAIDQEGPESDFVAQIVHLCRVRGLNVILEGVETELQYSLLRKSGAVLFQGFLFGKPMPIQELAQLLKNQPQ